MLIASRNSLTDVNSLTNEDGRCLDLLPPAGSELAQKENTELIAGQTYKVVFKTKEYFDRSNRKSFYPWVEVTGGNLLNLFAAQIYHRLHLRSKTQNNTTISPC